jgi:dCTP deaminase
LILCDHHSEAVIRERRITVDPMPEPDQFSSSAVDLRVGADFLIWKAALRAPGGRFYIDLDRVSLTDLLSLTEPLTPNAAGVVAIPPASLVLVRTLERISLPKESKLAARVEGRSKQARLGLTAHITAPTIHAGFSGHITLEIINHGPFWIEVRPNHSRLCQLILEEVSDVPLRGGSQTFSGQQTPLG